ncbi:hypothetical protein TorRG33x02_331540, partial [Trema orientale]
MAASNKQQQQQNKVETNEHTCSYLSPVDLFFFLLFSIFIFFFQCYFFPLSQHLSFLQHIDSSDEKLHLDDVKTNNYTHVLAAVKKILQLFHSFGSSTPHASISPTRSKLLLDILKTNISNRESLSPIQTCLHTK